MTTLITVNDAAALGYCRKGCRQFAERYGMDYQVFLRDGISESAFDGIDDEMVRAVIAQARLRQETENGKQ